MTDIQTASVTPMDEITVRLGDLGLAPENLRFQEPADDGVPQLAETVLAAGVLIPPIVRAGRKGEQPFMALDGRRRRFALLALRDMLLGMDGRRGSGGMVGGWIFGMVQRIPYDYIAHYTHLTQVCARHSLVL